MSYIVILALKVIKKIWVLATLVMKNVAIPLKKKS